MQGLQHWGASTKPFSQPITEAQPSTVATGSAGMSALLALITSAKRGLLIVAELTSAQDVLAALSLSRALGWPVVADALSGAHTYTQTGSNSLPTQVWEFLLIAWFCVVITWNGNPFQPVLAYNCACIQSQVSSASACSTTPEPHTARIHFCATSEVSAQCCLLFAFSYLLGCLRHGLWACRRESGHVRGLFQAACHPTSF